MCEKHKTLFSAFPLSREKVRLWLRVRRGGRKSATDSAAENESSGSQDNIDNESESRQRAIRDLSPQCKQSEPVMDRELEELRTDERKKKRGKPKKAEYERKTGKDKKFEEFWRREELGREEISYDRPGNRNIKADGESERPQLDEGSIYKRKKWAEGDSQAKGD